MSDCLTWSRGFPFLYVFLFHWGWRCYGTRVVSIFPMYLRMTIYPTKWSFNFFIFNLVNCKVSLYMQWLITFKKNILKILKKMVKVYWYDFFFVWTCSILISQKNCFTSGFCLVETGASQILFLFLYSKKVVFYNYYFFFYINFLNTGLFKESKLISLNKNFIQNLSPMYFNVLKVICIN